MSSLFDAILGTSKKVQIIAEDTQELIKIDATTAEEHSMESKLTEHEIEDGSTISDNVTKKGMMLSLEGVVSDNPISLSAALVGNVAGIVGGAVKGSVGKAIATGAAAKIGSALIGDSDRPSLTAQQTFESIYEESLLLTIVTDLRTYTNMIMESFKASVKPGEGEVLRFNATFRTAVIVESEIALIPILSVAKGLAAMVSKKRKLGGLSSVLSSGKTASKGASIALNLARAVGG